MLAVDRRKQGLVPAEELAAKAVAKTLPHKEEPKKVIRCAGCQVLQQIARATEETPEAHFAFFRDWQRTHAQFFCDSSLELEAANGCPVLREQGPPAERCIPADGWSDQMQCAFS